MLNVLLVPITVEIRKDSDVQRVILLTKSSVTANPVLFRCKNLHPSDDLYNEQLPTSIRSPTDTYQTRARAIATSVTGASTSQTMTTDLKDYGHARRQRRRLVSLG